MAPDETTTQDTVTTTIKITMRRDVFDKVLSGLGYVKTVTTYEQKRKKVKLKDFNAGNFEIDGYNPRIAQPLVDEEGNELPEDAEIEIEYDVPVEVENEVKPSEFLRNDITENYLKPRLLPVAVNTLTEEERKIVEEKAQQIKQDIINSVDINVE